MPTFPITIAGETYLSPAQLALELSMLAGEHTTGGPPPEAELHAHLDEPYVRDALDTVRRFLRANASKANLNAEAAAAACDRLLDPKPPPAPVAPPAAPKPAPVTAPAPPPPPAAAPPPEPAAIDLSALAQLQGAERAQALVKLISVMHKKPDPEVPAALATLGDAMVMPALRGALQRWPDEPVFIAAVQAAIRTLEGPKTAEVDALVDAFVAGCGEASPSVADTMAIGKLLARDAPFALLDVARALAPHPAAQREAFYAQVIGYAGDWLDNHEDDLLRALKL